MNKKELIAVIDEVLAARGYQKRGPAWYRQCPETVLVLDLQKSDYGGQFYINLAVSLQEMKTNEFPPEHLCDIRFRLERAVLDKDTVSRIFDLEDYTLSNGDRIACVQELIGKGADWLQKFSTIDGLAEQVRGSDVVSNRTSLKLKRYLGIPTE